MFSGFKAFEIKLKLLHKHINEQNLDHFPFSKLLWNLSSNHLNG
jgi:hypothetical protein